MSSTPLEQLISSVAPVGCRLINLPRRIWVFGGFVEPDLKQPSASLRDSFWRQTFHAIPGRPWFAHLDRPENHQGWWAFSGYDNLLQFERDACYLASQTILFSESPGAFAELGALALDESILPRLFVVVQGKFLEADKRESFLNLGPLKRVDLHQHKCIIGSPEKATLNPDDLDAIIDTFELSFDKRAHKSEELDVANPTHRLLLIADLVDLMLVSKVVDLQRALLHFKVALNEAAINQALSLLNFFGFVRLEMRGTEPFWVRLRGGDAPWMNYTSITAHIPFDRTRFKVESEKMLQTDLRRKSMLERGAA